MKKIIALLLCFCLFGVSAQAASLQFAIGNTQVKTLDTQSVITEKSMEIAPFTVEGRTMVPVRVIAESFGAQVGWDDATQTATISTDAIDIALTIGSSAATVNGETVTLDVAAMEQNGRTLVPLRFISEVLGYNVKYVPSTQQIYITDSPVVFQGNHSFVTFEELMLQYREAALMYLPSAESGASEEEIMTGKLELLSELFNFYATYCSVYDYALYTAPEGVDAQVYTDFAAGAESIAAQAEALGDLDVVWNALYEMTYIANSYAATLIGRVTPEEIQAAYNEDYICAKHILIPTVNLQNGAALSSEEVAAAEALANDLCAQIDAGTDFDALMHEYSEDGGLVTNPDGYVFTEGEMVEEFYNGAKTLEIGEVSAPVLSPFGYHIIKREPLPEVTQDFANSYARAKLQSDLQTIMEAYNFELVMDLNVLLNML